MRRALTAICAAVLLCSCAGMENRGLVEPELGPVEAAMAEMSLEDKLWQLFFVTPEAVSGWPAEKAVSEDFAAYAKKRPVGGVILFADNISSKEQVTAYVNDIKAAFATPVFVGVDEEGGLVSRLGSKGIITDNGDMRDIGDTGDSSAAAAVGERLGRELSEIGFNLDFAPVADTITNPANTEIGRRSFGVDPELVSRMAAAEVEAMQSGGVSAVLKHFPGHGSTSANSHKGISVSERTLDELRSADLKPFEAGIRTGADFVMVSHMSLPNVTGSETPCSLSPEIITGLLREELGYGGVVITDALNMGAVTSVYGAAEAAVAAFEAGADMLLMPESLPDAHDALLKAVEEGRVSEARVDESVRRILSAKERRGLL